MDSPTRPLRRIERALAYAMLGVAAEVIFTAARDALDARTRNGRLQGHSYLWMLPIYGLAAYLFEPLHDAVRRRPASQRAALYAAGIMSVEYAAGMAIGRATGAVPWDYADRSRWAVPGGAVRLDYAPVWAGAGLLLERVHDGMSRVRLRGRGPGATAPPAAPTRR